MVTKAVQSEMPFDENSLEYSSEWKCDE